MTLRSRSFVVVLGLAVIGVIAQAKDPPRVHPKADALLRKMSKDLAAMKTFSFDADHITEVVTEDGEKIQVPMSSTATVHRPNKIRSDRHGDHGNVSFYYDGEDLTVYGAREKLYATAKAPASIDKTIDFAREALGLEAPAADLLYSDSYTALMEDVVSGHYVGLDTIDDRTCHHLAYRGHETDWQIWIDAGERALPCRFVITSKRVKGSPEYSVDLQWTVDPTVHTSEFHFTPPPDAARIDFFATTKKPPKHTGPLLHDHVSTPAVIGRPLTSMSYVGVARRTTRRGAYAEATTSYDPATVITELPPNCKRVRTNDSVTYDCGDVIYRPYYDGPTVVYQTP
jgi:hypothetical protein